MADRKENFRISQLKSQSSKLKACKNPGLLVPGFISLLTLKGIISLEEYRGIEDLEVICTRKCNKDQFVQPSSC